MDGLVHSFGRLSDQGARQRLLLDTVVQEVIRYQEMTAVPLAARTIQGLINLRGQIVYSQNVCLPHRLNWTASRSVRKNSQCPR